MARLVITEEEKNSIRSLHGIVVEQKSLKRDIKRKTKAQKKFDKVWFTLISNTLIDNKDVSSSIPYEKGDFKKYDSIIDWCKEVLFKELTEFYTYVGLLNSYLKSDPHTKNRKADTTSVVTTLLKYKLPQILQDLIMKAKVIPGKLGRTANRFVKNFIKFQKSLESMEQTQEEFKKAKISGLLELWYRESGEKQRYFKEIAGKLPSLIKKTTAEYNDTIEEKSTDKKFWDFLTKKNVNVKASKEELLKLTELETAIAKLEKEKKQSKRGIGEWPEEKENLLKTKKEEYGNLLNPLITEQINENILPQLPDFDEQKDNVYRAKDWWRAEEILWDKEIEYDNFKKTPDGVIFTMGENMVAFYSNESKRLIVI